MKRTKVFIAAIAILLIAGAGYLFFTRKTEKAAYIDTSVIYNDFRLKKELEGKMENIRNARKSVLDSMELRLKSLMGELQAKPNEKSLIEQFGSQRQEYLHRKESFEEDNERLADEYTGQIWKQLNQYISDYGKENGYSFIYGASGNGSLMYADKGYDITKQATEYANSRYNGTAK